MAFPRVNQCWRIFPRHRSIGCLSDSSKHVSTTSVRAEGAYDYDGKTVVSVLNHEHGAPLMVNGYSAYGFRLNNGLFAVGPVAIFPRSILSWNVENDNDINEKTLSLFLHMWPRLDILIIGMSDARQQKLILQTRENVHRLIGSGALGKMNVEVLPTERAVTVFNFLNSEQRFVGGAFIPPIYYTPTVDDEYRTEFLKAKKEEGNFLES